MAHLLGLLLSTKVQPLVNRLNSVIVYSRKALKRKCGLRSTSWCAKSPVRELRAWIEGTTRVIHHSSISVMTTALIRHQTQRCTQKSLIREGMGSPTHLHTNVNAPLDLSTASCAVKEKCHRSILILEISPDKINIFGRSYVVLYLIFYEFSIVLRAKSEKLEENNSNFS